MSGELVDVEQLLVDWLQDRTEVSTVTELPPDITDPILQVFAYGGAATSPATDSVNLDIDAYYPPDSDGEPDLGAAQDLAQWVRKLMVHDLPGYKVTVGPVQGTVLQVREISRPVRRTYDESGIRRIHASYRLLVASRG